MVLLHSSFDKSEAGWDESLWVSIAFDVGSVPFFEAASADGIGVQFVIENRKFTKVLVEKNHSMERRTFSISEFCRHKEK